MLFDIALWHNFRKFLHHHYPQCSLITLSTEIFTLSEPTKKKHRSFLFHYFSIAITPNGEQPCISLSWKRKFSVTEIFFIGDIEKEEKKGSLMKKKIFRSFFLWSSVPRVILVFGNDGLQDNDVWRCARPTGDVMKLRTSKRMIDVLSLWKQYEK